MRKTYIIAATICVAALLQGCSSDNNSVATTAPTTPAATPLPAQTGAISVDLGTEAVTVSSDFADLGMSGTASFNDVADTLTISLEVDSDFDERILYNPKVWITTTSEGSLDTTQSFAHTFEGADYVYYGPEAMEAGTPVTRDIVLTGVTITSGAVTVDVSLTDSPMMISRERYSSGPSLIDTATGLYWGTIDCTPQAKVTRDGSEIGVGSGGCGHRNIIISADGTTLYSSNKTHPSISAIDMVTHDYTGLNLSPSGAGSVKGSANYLQMSADGNTLYVLINFNVHMTASQNSNTAGIDADTEAHVQIVKVDVDSFSISDRTTLDDAVDGSVRARNISLSPDGSTLAVLFDGDKAVSGIYLVNTSDLSVKDEANMPIKLAPEQVFAKKIIFVDDDTLAVGYGGFGSNDVTDDTQVEGDVISLIDLSSASYTRSEITSRITSADTDDTNTGIGAIVLGPDGMIYWTRQWGDSTLGWLKDAAAYTGSELLSVINPTTGDETLVQVGEDSFSGVARDVANVIAFDPSGDYYYTTTSGYGGSTHPRAVVKIDAATHTRVDYDGDTTNGTVGNSDAYAKVTPASNDFANGHEAVITPF